MFSEVFKKIICVCLYVCHMCSVSVSRVFRGQEGVRSVNAEVTDGYELLGTELESSERATRALN